MPCLRLDHLGPQNVFFRGAIDLRSMTPEIKYSTSIGKFLAVRPFFLDEDRREIFSSGTVTARGVTSFTELCSDSQNGTSLVQAWVQRQRWW